MKVPDFHSPLKSSQYDDDRRRARTPIFGPSYRRTRPKPTHKQDHLHVLCQG